MADLATFHQKVQEYLFDRGLTQRELAININMSHQELNRRLKGTGKTAITCVDVRSIVKGLTRLDAITSRQQARDLLDLMECDHFDQADWEAEPLNDLKPDPPPPLNRQEESFLLLRKYLERLSRHSQSVTLPIAPRHPYPLQRIFQPLKLRQDPLAAEDLPFSERRALLDEPSRGEYDPRRLLRERGQERAPESWRSNSQVVIANGLADALQRSKGRVLVVGPPGSGKTTTLRAFVGDMAQRELAHPTGMIPILIQLRLLTGTDYTLQSALRVMLGALSVDEEYARTLWHEIQHGRACLCIDGLDEVPVNQREMVVSWISALASERGNRWIISSRFAEFHAGLFRREQFYEWELQPLSPAIRHRLAEGLINEMHQQLHGADAASGRDAGAFLRALERHPRVSTWGQNPLLVSLTAVVFVLTGAIPTSRAALYQKVIDAVLETRQGDKGRRADLRLAASFLALKFFLRDRRTVTYEKLLDLLAGYTHSLEANEGLARDLLHSGLLEVVAENTYGYWHSTYQEFFAALELAERLTSDERSLREHTQQLISEKRTKGQWIEILRLLVGILVGQPKKEAEQRALEWLHTLVDPYTQPDEPHDPGNLGLVLAVQSLGEVGAVSARRNDGEWRQLEDAAAQAWVQAFLEAADHKREGRQERLVEVAEDIGHFGLPFVRRVKQQLTAALTHHPAQTRVAALRALGKLGKDVPMDLLIEALGDRHSSVREAAVHALVDLGENAPFDMLVRQALKSKHLVVRVAATHALGELGKPASVKRLLPGLSHKEWSLREATVVAIGNLGERALVKPLLNCLRDENSEVRQAAVAALGKLGGNDDRLLAVLRDDRNDSVRAEVFQVVGKRTPVRDLIEEVMCPPHLIPYSLAYRAAAELLGEVAEEDIHRVLSQTVSKSGRDRWSIIQVIRESQQEPSTEELLTYLYGNDQRVCFLAANLLGRRGEWERLERFITSLEGSRSGFTRAIAVRLLGRLGEGGPVSLLLAALTDTEPAVRLAAVRAFEEMGERIPAEAGDVIGLLNDPDRKISIAAMRVAAQVAEHILVDAPLLETLFAACESPYKSVVQAALRCLRKLERRVTSDQIVELLHHQDASLRFTVMSRLGSHVPMKHMAKMLQDKDDRIRVRAAEEIAERYYEREIPLDLLLQALNDENALVRHYAFTALRNRGEEELLADYYDEEGIPFFPHPVTADARERIEELPRATKVWDDGVIGAFTTIIEPELPERPDPGPGEELRPMDEAKKEAIKKHMRVDQLLAALQWPNAQVRLEVLQVLEKDVPEDRLIAALDDEDRVVRRKALQLLEKRTPTHLLGAALGDEYPFVRDVAAALLRSRRDRVSQQDMRGLLESLDGRVRASAILALEERIPRALLLAALGDSEEEVRLAAFDALRRTYPEMLPVIQSELTALLAGTGSSRIVSAAVQSNLCDLMANMDEVPLSWREKLTSLLDPSQYWEVRVKAAQALGKLRRDIPPEAVERLKATRKDPESSTVQIAADDALTEILSFEPGVDEIL